MTQQTAVEWLIQNINSMLPTELVEQAKQMEKEQHYNTWTDSRTEHKGDDYIGKEITFEQHYNETYGKAE